MFIADLFLCVYIERSKNTTFERKTILFHVRYCVLVNILRNIIFKYFNRLFVALCLKKAKNC